MHSGARFIFASFELDSVRRSLSCAGQPVPIADRQLDVLLLLVARAGQIVSKDDLLEAAWKDVAVGDNSLEQAISNLRKLLATERPSGAPAAPGSAITFIETVPRRGYRFAAPVARSAPRESDAALDALLQPHRAFVEGRAALETLDASQILRAREVFEGAVASLPELASAHLGLANACVLQFESTRADLAPDRDALALAARHAREACRLAPQSGEAWATLGFVLDRTKDRLDARAAATRAVSLEPDNWRHHFRLAYVSWGEERLRAADRTRTLLPGFPLARWLAATVHVARQALPEAERELAAAIASGTGETPGGSRFSPVALHWLLGLIHNARGDQARALEELQLELSHENSGHLYARECSANAYYAVGAIRLRQQQPRHAAAAFERAIACVPGHGLARAGLLAATTPLPAVPAAALADTAPSVDGALCRAAYLTMAGRDAEAAQAVEEALTRTPADSAGWLLPIEPLLHVHTRPGVWARALHLLRNRAA